ncbi:MAG: phosphotransferase, partial [Acidimicrobiia bacterium]
PLHVTQVIAFVLPLAWSPMAVPEGIRSVSTEWLTEALGVGGPGSNASVTSFRAERVGEEQGWTGELARIEISYSEYVEGAPSSVIAKFSPPDPDHVFSLHEVRFYQEIAAGKDFSVPYCHYGEVDPENGAAVLLLEDLSRLRTVRFLDGCTPKEAEAAVMALARIHAAWWGDEALESMGWLLTIAETGFSGWWTRYPNKIKTILPEFEISRGLMEFGDLFATDMPLILDRIEGAPFTCVHRDIHLDNLLFGSQPDDPSAVLIDWQTTGRGKGISDVAYLLISSLSPQDRRRSERRLVDLYHRYLISSGVEGYTLDQCWSDYIVSAASKLFITVKATVHFNNMSDHRRAWRAADLHRLMAFIDDHNPINEL